LTRTKTAAYSATGAAASLRDEHCEHTIREEAHPIGTELYAEVATSRLLWFNFAHLFSVSLIPFATEWIAESRLANAPVALYAAVFVLVNVTYLALCWEAVDRPAHEDVSQRMRRLLRMRSFVTIGVFLAAGLIALKWPVVAMTLICLCLITYLRPDVPGRDAA